MVLVMGVMFFFRLGLDILPDIEYPVVSVVTSYAGVSSEEIESSLTKPIEDAVATVNDVKSITSSSREGLSTVIIEFNQGTNIDFAAQDVRDKVSSMGGILPSNASQPLFLKMDTSAMSVLGYGVISESLSPLELREILEDNVKDKLERLDGVASVDIVGGPDREIYVKLDKDLLESYGLSQMAIVQSLASENINYSGGFIEENNQEFLLRTLGEYQGLGEVRKTIVGAKNGIPIYLEDVAEVSDTHEEVRGYCRTNQEDSILLMVNKQSGANTIQVAESVKEEIPKLKDYLPKDVDFVLVSDQSRIIQTSTNSVAQSAIIGGLLTIFLIFFFLKDWRPTLAIILAIPLSLIATFIPLYLSGYTLNLMTLGGLALGVGMLVDNAVVVIENIYRHLEEGESKKRAAELGASEVGLAITAATLTTIAVFIPMVLGSDIAGQLSRGLALTVAFALACSLLVALTLVPMVASKIFKKKKEINTEKKPKRKRWSSLHDWYKKVLKKALKYRTGVVLTTVGLLIVTVVLVSLVGAEFMPPTDQGTMMMRIKMPVGTSLEKTNQAIIQIEKIMSDIDALDNYTTFTGMSGAAGGSIGGGGVNEALVMVKLKEKEDRNMSSARVENLIRENTPPIRGLEISFIDVASMMMGSSDTPIEIKAFGKDLAILKEITEDIAEKVSGVEGVRDVDISLDQSSPELVININREVASSLGLSAGEIGAAVRNSMQGVVATQLRTGGEEIDIRVRYDEDYRGDIESIEKLTIVSSVTGLQIPLKQVATISKGQGPVSIDRENQLRVVAVTANIVDRDVNSVIKDIQREIDEDVFPAGYFIEYGGSYEQMKDTFTTLGWALLLGIALVYMVMAAQFESLVHPFVVMFEIPLAFIGVGFALLITGQTISLPVFMGVIMLAGIVVNNAIVLIDYINQLRGEGMAKEEAIIKGGLTRLRPILITSSTTILGMIPMALTNREGSEIMKPMAISVIGGLAVSTILTLIVIPVAYSLIESVTYHVKKRIL
jgi:HAE1 family hydrophobic/amphiphilic exporter-1